MTFVERLRAVLADVVWRSALLMVLATVVVALAFVSGLADRAARHTDHGAAIVGHASAAVHSEADYLAGLIAQRQEAVDRASELQGITERDEVRALADSIVSEHGEETEQLRAWLAAWHQERAADASAAAAAVAAQEPLMRPFTGLRPAEADHVFVADMRHHHEAVLALAESYLALRGPKRPEVVAHAEDVQRLARAEIAVLALMLRMWDADAVPTEHGAH